MSKYSKYIKKGGGIYIWEGYVKVMESTVRS